MTGLAEGFRWALLGGMAKTEPPGALFVMSVVITVLVLASGAMFFPNTERTFADIV